MKRKNGVIHHIGVEEAGVITVRQGGEVLKLMLFHDILEKEGVNKYFFEKHALSKITRILRVQKKQTPTFSIFACVSGNEFVPKYFSDENGIFTALINNEWRKCQLLKDFQSQHGLKGKNNVRFKMDMGTGGIQRAVFHRLSKEQTLTLVVLPNVEP